MNIELKLFRADDGDVWGSALSGAATGAGVGSLFPGLGTVIGGVAGGAIGLFSGLSQKKKGQSIVDSTQYPLKTIPSALRQNKTIAEARANQGLPSAQYKLAADTIRENQVASLQQAQDRRGALQAIPAIQKVSGKQYAGLNAADAAARNQNINQLLGVNTQYAGAEDRQFDWNRRNKYLQDYNYGMSLLGMGNQNMIGGLDSLGSAAALLADRYGGFGGRRNRTTSTTSTANDSFYNTPLRKADINYNLSV